MFTGFEALRITTKGGGVSRVELPPVEVPPAEIHCLSGGTGPPLLLVHGYPQTHVMWHKVAPALAERFTVVAPDLRGYGASSKPAAGEGFGGYSKRAMARDLVEVMAALGHERFAVMGHDRGGRVSYRLALDSPERVSRLVTLDIMPTLDTFELASGRAARGLWHWYFLAQPPPLPERLIAAERELFLERLMRAWVGSDEAITEEAYAAYLEAWTDETIRATCDDYRAGARIDSDLDAADRSTGRRITAPMLALWGGVNRDLLSVWQRWATDVRGVGLDCGHFIAEEVPDELLEVTVPFLSDGVADG